MKLDIKELVSQVTMVRLKAESLAAESRVLEQTLRQLITDVVASTETDQPPGECKCPATMRTVARTEFGQPVRTKCRMCGKEHENGKS